MWELIRANRRKSAVLVVFMAALLFCAGYACGLVLMGPEGGPVGLLVAFGIWMILTLTAWFQGRELFMAVSGAHKIEKKDHPRLFNIVEEMTIAAQLPAMPDVYIIDTPALNAFATGRKPEVSAVAVTAGLLNRLNRDELQGVIAHEIGHVKNRDILFMTMVGVMMGAVVMLADITVRALFWGGGRTRSRTSSGGGGQAQLVLLVVGIVLLILAPLLARIIYLAASRKREYLADASGARFTRYPEGLARALEKIAASPVRLEKANRVTAPMFIVNPMERAALRGGKRRRASLFSTHPPVEERIRILRSMAGGAGFTAYDEAFREVTGARTPVLPPSALSVEEALEAAPVEGRAPLPAGVAAAAVVAEPSTLTARVRETGDALWKARDHRFIRCPCGAVLKVPAQYTKKQVPCLRCRRFHEIPPSFPAR